MSTSGPRADFLDFPWDFYERAIKNYSVIMQMMDALGSGERFLKDVPRVFVEQTGFEVCKIFIEESHSVQENSFTFDGSPDDLSFEEVARLNAGALTPKVFSDVPGFGPLFIYPLKDGTVLLGFLILGKKYSREFDTRLFRECEILCEVFNKSLLFNQTLSRLKEEKPATLHEATMHDFPHSFMVMDRNGRICYANSVAKVKFQGRKGLLTGEHIRNIFFGVDDDLLRAEETVEGEVGYRVEGTFRLFRMECYPVKYRGGIYKGVFLQDIADRRIIEEEEVQKETVENVGMLAGGIAHDFNNILTGILGYASLMTKHLPRDDRLFQYAELIEASAQRAAELTKHLLNFSKRRGKPSGGVKVNALLGDVLYLLKESFINMTVEEEFDESIPSIRGDESELQRVFLSLCVNARDAMDGSGVLKAVTRRERLGGKEYVMIEIKDTGRGIDEESRHKMFEPFFNTGGQSDNAGIGLYVIQKIIADNNGLVEVESKEGEGTTFTIYLPLEIAMIDNFQDVQEKEDTSKKMKALIVDDERIVRGLLKGILTEEGFVVLEAENGNRAIELCKEYGGTVDLLILDTATGDPTGNDILSAFRAESEHGKIIVSSGFIGEEQKEELKKFRIDGILRKPYRSNDVIQILSTVFSDH